MDRRRFLLQSAIGSGALALGCGIWGRRAFARYHLQRSLVSDALPVLMDKAHSEFQSVPARAREEIRQWVHGKVLNVASFVDEVCSNSYRENLHACPSEEGQNNMLLATFCGKVATDSEILNRVQVIAEEVGQELNTNWGNCCREISKKWNMQISEYSSNWDYSEFMGRIDRLVMAQLNDSLALARANTQSPVLGETLGNIGKSALMLMPVTRIKIDLPRGRVDINPVGSLLVLPTFLFISLKHVFQYVTGLLSDPRSDLQTAISGRMSLLGNRVGSEFESEMRARLGALHEWQQQSFNKAADHYADTSVGWL